MENASNALIIAGAILIAIIVLSIGVYLVVTYSKVGNSYEQEMTAVELTKFNTKFTVFQDRNDISAQEIVTLKNFIEKYNDENDPDVKIQIKKNAGSVICEYKNSSKKIKYTASLAKDDIDFLKKYSTKNNGTTTVQMTFTCNESDISWNNGKVESIKFILNP